MTIKIQSIKGMPDILPNEVPLWHQFESLWHQLMHQYGIEEIRLPILEATPLFKRSIGEVTDIVEKEMFSFFDKDGDSLTLRPEGTAGTVRAGLEHGLLYHQIQKLWYMGPMFRYEKPQKGRYRQFHQVGVEAFGLSGPDIDAEQILMMQRFWKDLKIDKEISLQINSLGSGESRARYRTVLVDYLSKYYEDLDEDSQRRLKTNPLRILDSKNADLAEIIANAPKCYDYLDNESLAHFEGFKERLEDAGLNYEVNPNIVRGLDYYNQTVYEWVTHKLGAQGTVCAGGRYDGLVEQLGGHETPAVGFAVGIERVILLLKTMNYNVEKKLDAYLLSVGEKPQMKVLTVAEALRECYPNLRLLTHCGGGNFKQQFKKADKSGAKIALILGETELESGTLGVKFLREEREQLSVPKEQWGQFLSEYFGS